MGIQCCYQWMLAEVRLKPFFAPFLRRYWHSMHRAAWQSLSLNTTIPEGFQIIVYIHKPYCSTVATKNQLLNLFLQWLIFSDQRAVFQIDHSSGTCLVHKKCIGHVLKISIHSFCLWTRQCLEVFKSLSNIHLENMSCVNNRCETMKLLAWLHHVCVCVHRTSTNSNALICFSLCDPAQGNVRIMKCWNMFEACFGWSQKRIQTVQDTNKFQQLCFLQLSPDSRTDVLLPIHAELYFNLSSTDTARGIVRYTGYNVFSFSLSTNT